MKKLNWLLLLVGLWLGITALAWGDELRLEPEVIAPGEVALARWIASGPTVGELRFNDKLIPLEPGEEGGWALLGLDLGADPGDYPLRLRLPGGTERPVGTLKVTAKKRPEERLTLPKAYVSPQDPAVLQRIERESKLLRQIFSVRSSVPLPTAFVLPVGDPMGSPFGLRRILNGQPRSPHAGVDFRSPRGTVVGAGGAGRVVFTGDLYYCGLTAIVDHGDGLYSIYCHLESLDCAPNQTVDLGTPLGRVGSTGRSTGPHLHWGVKLRGDRVDPLALTTLLGGKKS
ncbi:M23 family metallopeptidase [Desulfuromonas acetexigens]|uniref:M23 family metallopeptidase n=1 Tax=Trichloromonas acetexigens TaxID=38815 RepID=A0A550J8D6_9BACT|nr:M23 family metallopeptidase [Desulfuromonas acetexigens]TRO79466.1 M23 family metallopeptidase [Desulfuromonas acetexigens]